MARSDVELQFSEDELEVFTRDQGNRLVSLFRRIRRALDAARTELDTQDVYLATALPTATARLQGRFTLIRNLGVSDDVLYVCLQETGGGYAWRQIS